MNEDIDVHRLALDKVGRILGPARASNLLTAFLSSWPRRERLVSAEDRTHATMLAVCSRAACRRMH